MRFQGKVCLVSGSGSGIGKAAAKQFASEGGKVVVIDLNEQHGNQTVQEITQAKGEAVFAKCNVGNTQEIQAAIKLGLDKWGKIDVVVNDAAMMTFKPIVDLPDDEWDKVLDVNVRSVFLFCKDSVPHMPRGGAIVNVSSVHAHETTKITGAIGKPGDIAAAICFLASPAARFITGTTLVADGGRLDILE